MSANETDTVLVLRTCNADLTSYDGFRWPESGPVSAPDWNCAPVCGGGLHGLLWGEGDGSLLNWNPDARWLVVRADKGSVVDLGGKVKFPRGEVMFCGARDAAAAYIVANGGSGRNIAGAIVTAGNRGTATAGYGGTATAGDGGTATAGDRGTATAGDGGTVIIRRWDTAKSRYRVAVSEVGDGALKPKTKYRLNDKHEFEEVPA